MWIFGGTDNVSAVLSGPADVSSTGLAFGETVPASTPATVRVAYLIKSSPTLGLSANWEPLTNFTTSDAGNVRTITDLSATGVAKFYRVRITRP